MRGALVGPSSPSPRRVLGGSPAVLALHGFGGTPREQDLSLDVASELGLAAHAPLLPGHGSSVHELAGTRYDDWLGAARLHLQELRAEHSSVIVVGISMGALLALDLALGEPRELRAVVLIANALRLHSPFPALALDLVDRLGIPDFWVPKVGADIADPAARRTHLTYDAQPVHAAISVLRAGERLRSRLPEHDLPTLVLHGARDRVCPAGNAALVRERAGTSDVTVRLFPRSRHILTRDLERRDVATALREFFTRLHTG